MSSLNLNASIVNSGAIALSNSRGSHMARLQLSVMGQNAITLLAIETLPDGQTGKSLSWWKSLWWTPITITDSSGTSQTVLLNKNSAAKRLEFLGLTKKEILEKFKDGTIEDQLISHKAKQVAGTTLGQNFSEDEIEEIVEVIQEKRVEWQREWLKDNTYQATEFVTFGTGATSKTAFIFFKDGFVEICTDATRPGGLQRCYFDFPEFSPTGLDTLLAKTNRTFVSSQDIAQIYSYVEKNKAALQAEAQRKNRSIYLRPKDSGLVRALQVDADGNAIIHLNRKKQGDEKWNGTSKDVSTAINLQTGVSLASAGSQDSFDDEVSSLNEFEGKPGFVQLMGCFSYPKKSGIGSKNRLLLEYYNLGDLVTAINRKTIKDEDKKNIFKDLVKIVAYLHKMNWLHRDIKLENVLISRDEKGNLKIAIADLETVCKTFDSEKCKKMKGTLDFLSPEYIQALAAKNNDELIKQASTKAHDMWALGCLLYQLLGYTLPWDNLSREMVAANLAALKGDPLTEPTKNTPEHLVWSMLRFNPKDRITVDEAEKRLSNIRW